MHSKFPFDSVETDCFYLYIATQESLMLSHYKYMRIDGTTKIADRAKVVKVFFLFININEDISYKDINSDTYAIS